MLIGQGPGKKNYYVLYPEGFKSEPMTKNVAKDYAEIFDGKVKRIKGALIRKKIREIIKRRLYESSNCKS